MKRKPPSSKGSHVTDPETRSRLLDAAARIMVEEGFPAVSAKRIGALMGINAQRVRDYFDTMDEVFIALLRRDAEFTKHRLDHAFASDEPFRALWRVYSDKEFTRLTPAYLALTHQREEIRKEAKGLSKRMRQVETEGLTRVLRAYGIDTDALPAAGVAIMFAAISSAMSTEQGIGFSDGHRDAIVVVNTLLNLLEQWREIGALKKLKRSESNPGAPRRTATQKTRPEKKKAASRRTRQS